MTTDRFQDRLSEYLDGELDPSDAALVERHLETCEDCAQILTELEAVAARARDLPSREPTDDLWPAIASRIEADRERSIEGAGRRRGRRIVLSVPQLAAAAVVLASLSAGVAWMARANTGSPIARVETSQGAARLVADAPEPGTAEYYARSIAELERALFDPTRSLPPQTEARVRRALVTIDRAIEDARRALLEVPDDPYLQDHVANTLRRKSEFLERAVRLASQS
ncbi:MAG: anti-sigma factor [Gemmatimonadetes bacterium]|nr:anti-sigma factor [Gemmatimonadota bacterium]